MGKILDQIRKNDASLKQHEQIMIADGNIFNTGPKMNSQTNTDDQMAEIERKLNNNEYDLNESDSDKSMPVIKD